MHTQKIISVVFFLLCCLTAFSQTQNAVTNAVVTPTGSINGQIKIGDNPAAGVVVTMIANTRGAMAGGLTKATTDADGRYKFANVAAGDFRLLVLAPGYVVFSSSDVVRNGQRVTVKDGESVERMDFAMTRGGVITGRVTNRDLKPVIGETITILTVDDAGQQTPFTAPDTMMLRTDDRGTYRVYGLPAGKYFISVGREDNRGGPPMMTQQNRAYQRTFYPDKTEVAEAAPVTVETGKEVTEIDIRMASIETFAASGRVVDGESGKPINGVLIAHRTDARNRRGGAGMSGGSVTDGTSGNEGEFRIEGLKAGTYAAFVATDQTTAEYYSEPTSFEISTNDVSGLEIKLQRAASISGIVILDGTTSPDILATLRVNANSRGGGQGGMGGGLGNGGANAGNVAPNGTFRVSGLAPGRVSLNVMDANNPTPFSGLSITRIERDGAEAQAGFEVQKGEQVMNVRVHIAKGSGVIRGLVRMEGGAVAGMRLMVMARRTDGASGGGGGGFGGGGMPTQVDANGRFQIENLVTGTYDVTVQAMGGGMGGAMGGGFIGRGGNGAPQGGQGGQGGQPMRAAAAARQTVQVTNGSVQDVTLTVDMAALQTPATNAPNNPQGNRPGGNGQNNPAGGGQSGQFPRRRQ